MHPHRSTREHGALRPIGVVSAETGIDPATLRVWERRYGFPKPVRRDSGHRLYAGVDVERLMQISQLLKSGFRAGEVLRATPAQLDELSKVNVGESGPRTARKAAAGRAKNNNPVVATTVSTQFNDLKAYIRHLDADGLRREFALKLATLGPREFVMQYVSNLAWWLGESWMRGDITIHEEHFVTHQLQTLLRAILAQQQENDGAPRIVLTTLPGEPHSLGIKMAGILAALQGVAPRILGTETPMGEIVNAARASSASVVGISVSLLSATRGTTQRLNALIESLPPEVKLWVGGRGARKLRGLDRRVERYCELEELEMALIPLGARNRKSI